MTRSVAAEISSLLTAIRNCETSGNKEWEHNNREKLRGCVTTFLPHGSGFDDGTRLDKDASEPQKLVFTGGYHHMDPSGFYSGWSSHTVTVTPTFSGIDVSATITEDSDPQSASDQHEDGCESTHNPDWYCECENSGWYSREEHEEYVAEEFHNALSVKLDV